MTYFSNNIENKENVGFQGKLGEVFIGFVDFLTCFSRFYIYPHTFPHLPYPAIFRVMNWLNVYLKSTPLVWLCSADYKKSIDMIF